MWRRGGGVEGRRGTADVEVMDLFMLRVPSMAERYEGQSYGCLYITLWDLERIRRQGEH